MANYKTVQFKVLPDNCAEEDLFDDKTHKQIADKLYEIIAANPKEGLTIGLEGEWGSGKSTVVKLLQERFRTVNPDKIFVFYIDAWEHEGDHLRRVFLETLIDKLKNWRKWDTATIEQLNEISDKVTSKKVAKTIEHTSQITGFGKWVAFAALFVPLGAALLSVFAEKVTTKWTGRICWEFWVSFLLTIAPVLVYLARWIGNLFKKQNDKSGYALFETEANVDTTYETSREEERSSVEFERYFGKIIQAVDLNQMVMVIDNLDRINPEDALRIWATLQAFVQNKNPVADRESPPCKWIIVPYAQEGLSKIWTDGKTSIDASADKRSITRPLSFMDKSFQLRLHVPKMVISGWKSFATQCLKEAAPDLDGEDVATILNVLSWTRESLTDAPSPRQIKIYVNQVGLVCSLHGSRVPLEAICFYVNKKYLKGLSDKQLEEELEGGEISPASLPQYAGNKALAPEVAAILYGVPKDKAMQILLGSSITSALEVSNSDYLRHAYEIHGNVFCDVLSCIFQRAPKDLIPRFASSVQKAFPGNEIELCRIALNALRLHRAVAEKQMAEAKHEDAIALIALAGADGELVKPLATAYLSSLPERFMPDGERAVQSGRNIEHVDNASRFVQCFDDVAQAAKKTMQIPYRTFTQAGMDFSKFSADELKQLAKYMCQTDAADADVANQIQEGKPIPTWVLSLFAALTANGMKAAGKTFDALNRAFVWNNGQRGPGIFGDSHWDIIMAAEYMDKACRPIKAIQTLTRGKGYWHFNAFPNNQTVFLLAKYSGSLNNQELTPPGFQLTKVNQYRQIWSKKDQDRGRKLYMYLSYSHEYEWLAEEAGKNNRGLVGSIVEAAIDANDGCIFKVAKPFGFLVHLWNLVDENHRKPLIENFISDETRLAKLFRDNEETMVLSPHVCLELLIAIEGEAMRSSLVRKIKADMGSLTQEQWVEALNASNALPELIARLEQDGVNLELANPFCEAFVEFVSRAIRQNTGSTLSTNTLVSMHKSMKMVLCDIFASGIWKALKETKFSIATSGVKDFVVDVPDYREMIKNSSHNLQIVASEVAKAGHVDAFDNLLSILQRSEKSLETLPGLSDILEQPVKAMSKDSDEKVKIVAEKAAKYLGIDLKEPEA